ncbi:DapH/DapD/GlmU-related protein [uncultured Desulfobacter sp.]|uniref:acyltransferase n=1 Tax=uncultured Desulfobacter sp. TaxID=240139 RepID=UPI002AAB34B8|nr:DapH/DapD/GlmU-related protein [uncultured Desulfobacter sp.]
MINSGGYLSAEGGLVIEDYVLIGPNCNILSAGHNYSDPDLYIQQQGLSYGKITIKKNAWIGASCVILQGITIGEGAIVGAGSVVTSDIPPMAIAVGNPSKVIKYRPGKYPCTENSSQERTAGLAEKIRLEKEIIHDTENSASQERTAGQQTISKEKVENQTGTNHEKIRLEKEIIQIHQGYQEEIKRLNTEIKEIHQSYQKKIDLLHAEMEEVHKGYGLKLMEQKKKQFPIRFSLRG